MFVEGDGVGRIQLSQGDTSGHLGPSQKIWGVSCTHAFLRREIRPSYRECMMYIACCGWLQMTPTRLPPPHAHISWEKYSTILCYQPDATEFLISFNVFSIVQYLLILSNVFSYFPFGFDYRSLSHIFVNLNSSTSSNSDSDTLCSSGSSNKS